MKRMTLEELEKEILPKGWQISLCRILDSKTEQHRKVMFIITEGRFAMRFSDIVHIASEKDDYLPLNWLKFFSKFLRENTSSLPIDYSLSEKRDLLARCGSFELIGDEWHSDSIGYYMTD